VGDLGGAEREEVGGRSQEGLACWGEVGDDCRRACGDRKLRPRQTALSGVASSSSRAGEPHPGRRSYALPPRLLLRSGLICAVCAV